MLHKFRWFRIFNLRGLNIIDCIRLVRMWLIHLLGSQVLFICLNQFSLPLRKSTRTMLSLNSCFTWQGLSYITFTTFLIDIIEVSLYNHRRWYLNRFLTFACWTHLLSFGSRRWYTFCLTLICNLRSVFISIELSNDRWWRSLFLSPPSLIISMQINYSLLIWI